MEELTDQNICIQQKKQRANVIFANKNNAKKELKEC